MTVLFTQSWDVIPGRFDEYSEFMTNEYNPALGRMGIHLLGWLLRCSGSRAKDQSGRYGRATGLPAEDSRH